MHNFTQGCTKFYMVAPKIFGFCVWNLLHATFPACRNFMLSLDLWKICTYIQLSKKAKKETKERVH
jgi:hypothetical protein